MSQIEQLLTLITTGSVNQQDIRQATAKLQELYKQPEAISTLLGLVATCPTVAVKQLAAVEARKLISNATLWNGIPQTVRDEMKGSLLNLAVNEQHNLVRHAVARVISEAAAHEMAAGRWTDLVGSLYTLCSSSTVSHREVGVYILFVLFEVIADQLSRHIMDIFNILVQLVGDQESLVVGVTCVQALGKVADFIETENQNGVKTFQGAIPSMVNVLQRCLSAGDDENVIKIFEVFDSLLLIEAPLLSVHFADLVQLYLGIAANRQHDDQVRVMAISFLMWCILYKKNQLQKKQLINPIISALLPIGTEDEPEDRDQDYPSKVAFQVLNSLATTFSPARVFPEVMRIGVAYLQSPNYGERKAAMMALAVLVEGCVDYMRDQVSQLISLVQTSLQDPHPVVRRAACLALFSLAEELDEEVIEQHNVLLPILFRLLDDPVVDIHVDALNALDIILENMDDAINLYLGPLMEKLISLLENGPRKVQTTTINCIGSAAHAAGEKFVPYFEQVMQRILVLISLNTTEEFLELRSVATDTAGVIAQAVGKERFAPYVQQVMHHAVQGLELNESRLLECSYVLFGLLARVFKEDFASFLPLVLPRLVKSCQTQEKDWNELLDKTPENEEEDLSAFDDDDHQNGFSMALAHEKVSSLDALGEMFEATRAAFLPYAPEAIHIVLSQFGHYHDGVRTSAVQCAFKFYSTCYEMSSPGEWTAGLPVAVPLAADVVGLAQMVMDAVLNLLEDEEDRMVVAQVFQTLSDTLKATGPGILSLKTDQVSHLDAFSNQVHQVLSGQHACQQPDEDEEEEEEELAELDGLAISAAADAVAAICAALGRSALPYFERFLPVISKYYKASRPATDRSVAVGSLAECVEGLESEVTPFTEPLFNLFSKAITDSEEDVASNAAFGLGVLVQFSTLDLSGHFPKLLTNLRPLFEPSVQGTNRTDNACGAVCRMILKAPNAVPLDHVLPVVLGHLPLKKDFEENTPIYECILSLLKSNNPHIVGHMPLLLQIFARVLAPPANQLKEPVRKQMQEFLNTLKDHHGDQFQALLMGLEGNHQSMLLNNLR